MGRRVLIAVLVHALGAPAWAAGAPPPTPAPSAKAKVPATPQAKVPGTPQAKVKVAVTEVKNVQGVAPGTATIISDIVVSEVARQGHEVVSQSDINAMLGFERQKKVLGCSEDSSCLAEIGGALGVDFMITGQVGQIGTRYRISLLAVDSRKARVVARAAQFCDQNEDALARAAETTVGMLLSAMRGEVPPPVAVAPSLEARPAAPVAAPVAAPAAPAVAVQQQASAHASANGRAAYVTLGAGGVLLVSGLLAGASARGAYSDLEARQGDLGYAAYFDANKARVHTLGVTADVLTGAGLVTAGVGAWLWWRARPGDPVAVLPVMGANGEAGIAASGRF